MRALNPLTTTYMLVTKEGKKREDFKMLTGEDDVGNELPGK